MTVKQWKRIILATIVLIIVITTSCALFFGINYVALSKTKEPAEELFKAMESGDIDVREYENLVKFLKNTDTETGFSYQNLYEDLYVDNDFEYVTLENKTCYLTFDDGPNPQVTPKVLDTLKKYDVKATFFVVYQDSEECRKLYKRIVDEGHTLALHTASHNYNQIYSSVDAYIEDFNKINRHVEEITGVKPEIFRFPGGSLNSYNKGIYRELISEMVRRGYTYYDWNVSSGDAASRILTSNEIRKNVVNSDSEITGKIVLMHDGPGHGNTADALEGIILGLKKQGYSFAPLTKDIKPAVFGY